MKRPRVYLDTSVLGGCFDEEFASWSNALVQDIRRGLLDAVVSELVAAEVAGAPDRVQGLYADLLGLGAEEIEATAEAVALADAYQDRGILTERFYDDGLHIALATVTGVDMLVSWNFRHIVHYEKIRSFNAVNLERGYRTLEIYTPREVVRYEDDER
jgi:non-ribosomal peptide synthetase component F